MVNGPGNQFNINLKLCQKIFNLLIEHQWINWFYRIEYGVFCQQTPILITLFVFMNIAPSVYKKIVAAKLFMDQNFHESIDLHHISQKACISRFHFHRLFTRVYNRTPHQYLTRKRIAQACKLLEDKKLTVTEICNSVGFESMGSFSALFKKEMGIGPSIYRNIILIKKEKTKTSPNSFIPNCFIDQYSMDR